MIIYRLKGYLTFAHNSPKIISFESLKAGKILFLGCICSFKTAKTQLDICVRINKKDIQAKDFDFKMF